MISQTSHTRTTKKKSRPTKTKFPDDKSFTTKHTGCSYNWLLFRLRSVVTYAIRTDIDISFPVGPFLLLRVVVFVRRRSWWTVVWSVPPRVVVGCHYPDPSSRCCEVHHCSGTTIRFDVVPIRRVRIRQGSYQELLGVFRRHQPPPQLWRMRILH